MLELFNFISQLITVYIFIIIASVIMSWLIGLGIVNPYNQLARSVWNFLQAVTEPALRPIRRLLPNFGSIDLSPLVLLLAMQFVQQVILPNLYRALAG
ncbi:MAG: YggT family protein [Hyphomicrobiaceae bacterium]